VLSLISTVITIKHLNLNIKFSIKAESFTRVVCINYWRDC